MSKFFYSTVLDEKVVKRAEINTRFADITTAVNTTKFDAEQMRQSSIRYRHLQQPPVAFLWHELSNRTRSGAPSSIKYGLKDTFAFAASNTWYPTNLRIRFNPSGTINDGGGWGCVYAELEHSGTCREGHLDIAIGYSTDNVTFNIYPFGGASVRTLGHMQGGEGKNTGAIWETRQVHPWTDTNTGAVGHNGEGWFPNSAYTKRTVMTMAPIIQRLTGAAPQVPIAPVVTGIHYWTLMVRVNDHTLDELSHHCRGRIWLVSRNREV